MLGSNTTQSPQERKWNVVLYGLIVVETVLVLLALVPAQLWTRILVGSSSATLDGPFPPVIAPFVTTLLYLMPTAIGFLCRNWQRALLLSTLPAWIGLGAFLIGATFKIGAFYMVANDHVTANVSVLELFAALGAIGWLGRPLFKMR